MELHSCSTEEFREIIGDAKKRLKAAKKRAEKMCARKRVYESEAQAILAKYKYDNEHDVVNSVYRCPICHKWHLTTHPWTDDETREDDQMEYKKYLLPAGSCRGYAAGYGSRVLVEMPKGCKHSGQTFVVPTKMTKCIDFEHEVAIVLPETWIIQFKDEDGKNIAEIDLDAFENELRNSFENGRISNPFDQERAEAVEREARAYRKQQKKEERKLAKNLASAGVSAKKPNNGKGVSTATVKKGTNSMVVDKNKKAQAIEYHEKMPALTSSEVAKLTGLSAVQIERIWNGEDEEEQKNSSASSGDLLIGMSQLSEQMMQTRAVLIETFGTTTLNDIERQLVIANGYLAVIASVLIEAENPNHKVSKSNFATLQDVMSSINKLKS